MQERADSTFDSGTGWSGLRWIPVLVGCAGAMLSVAGWSYLVMDRRGEILSSTKNVSVQARRTAAVGVRNHVSALRNLAGFWSAVGRRPVEEWRADAQVLMENHPSILYIAWIYPDGRRARVAAGRYESPDSVDLGLQEAERSTLSAQILGPEPSDTGQSTFRVVLPVRRGTTDLGALEARIDASTLLSAALSESAPGYAIRVLWEDQQLFARGEPTTDRWQSWWTHEGPVPLPLDTSWRATFAPTPELAAVWLDPVPHYLLAVGIVLAVTLAMLSHHLHLNYLRTQHLEQGNIALEASAGELRKLNEALEARVAERTQELEAFTHSISHDLKSPLGAILNFAAILELDYRNALDADGLEILTRIRASAARGSELLEGLLRLSRAGHSDLRTAQIDMNRLARESFAQARQTDLDPDVEFVLEPLPDAKGDRALVRELLVNLFDNALKYSREREKRRVGIRGRAEADRCVYEVEDNGQGFDMKYSDKLFGTFQRLPSSQSVEGTGVGLALVARIVARHGGRVWAYGRLGEGATFTFTLPRGGSIDG